MAETVSVFLLEWSEAQAN